MARDLLRETKMKKQAEALSLRLEKDPAPAPWPGDAPKASEERLNPADLFSAYFDCLRRAAEDGRILLIHSPEVLPDIFYAFPSVFPVLDELLPLLELCQGFVDRHSRNRLRWGRQWPNLCPLDQLKLAAVINLQMDHRVLAVGTTSACDSHLAYFKVLQCRCEDSVFLLDAPFRSDEPSEDFRERQVWDLVEFLAAKTGQPPDWSRCSETMGEARDLAGAILKLLQLEQAGMFPFPSSFAFYKSLLYAAAGSTPTGMRKANQILQARIAPDVVPDGPGARLRIGWLEMTPFPFLPFVDLLESQWPAVTVIPLFPRSSGPRPRLSSLKDLVRFTAANVGRHPCSRDLSLRLETSLAAVVQSIEACKVDAVLLTYQKACLNVLSLLEPIKGLFRSMRIPFLNLQTDPFAPARVVRSRSARLQAFLADCADRRRLCLSR